MKRTGHVLLALPLFLAVALGCSASQTPALVQGKVTYNGSPVNAGTITFHSEAGGIYTRTLMASGFSLTDLPEGSMVVTIETESVNPAPKKDQAYVGRADPSNEYQKRMEQMGKRPQAAQNTSGEYVKIPAKYASKEKSPLRVTITKGTNDFTFDLKDD